MTCSNDMKNQQNRIIYAASLALMAGLLIINRSSAQPVEAPAANQPPAGAAPAEETPAEPVVVNVKGDAGVAVVQQAQAEADGEHYKQGVSAEELIHQWLKKDGLDNIEQNLKKGRIIAVQSSTFDSEEPNENPAQFVLRREIAVQKAMLFSRAQIIETINTKMDALAQADTPGTELNAKFGEKLELLQTTLENQQKTLATLLKDVDKKQADELAGVTEKDRANAMIDAAIKKLDSSYSAQNIEAGKKKKLEEAKAKYQKASQEIARIQEEIRKVPPVLDTFKSTVKTVSKMPLFGATCIYQTESWNADAKQYTVAVALAWSTGLEKATRAIIQGQEVAMDKPKKGITFEQWLEGQDLGSMIGSRTFMTENGDRYFIGIAARAVLKNAALSEQNRTAAELYSKANAAMSLRADVESVKEASLMAQTTMTESGGSDMQVEQSVKSMLQAALKNQNINGLSILKSSVITHSLTGIKLRVVVSGISPEGAKLSRTAEEVNYAAAIAANKENSRLQGRKDQLEASKQSSVNDKASYSKGRKDAVEALDKQEADRQAEMNKRQAQSAQAQAAKSKAASQKQAQTLDGTIGSKPKQADDF